MTTPTPTVADTRPAWAILTLAIGPAIGLGICRFAYSLVLPDMRDTLGWSYATSGAMNTVNAAGYLAGALLAAPVAKRIGLLKTIHLGIAMCLASLAISSLSGAPVPFGLARILSGIGGAFAQLCGGALTAISAVMAVPLLRLRLHPVSGGTGNQGASVKPIWLYLAGYFLYGAGYI